MTIAVYFLDIWSAYWNLSATETERSSGWQPWYSLQTLKASFKVSNAYQDSHPDDLPVSMWHTCTFLQTGYGDKSLAVPYLALDIASDVKLYRMTSSFSIYLSRAVYTSDIEMVSMKLTDTWKPLVMATGKPRTSQILICIVYPFDMHTLSLCFCCFYETHRHMETAGDGYR